MAYIPPHKKFSSSSSSPSPTPAKQSELKQQKYLFSKKEKEKSSKDILFAKDAITEWFPVGLSNTSTTTIEQLTHLNPLSSHTIDPQWKKKKPLVLVLNHRAFEEEIGEQSKIFTAEPWNIVAETVKQDLFLSFERVKNELSKNDTVKLKPEFVARIGTIHFHRGFSSNNDPIESDSLSESGLRKLRKTFYTTLPTSYVDYVINEVVPKLGISLEAIKDRYHVIISDNKLHDRTLSCNCAIGMDHGKLELLKVEVNAVRHYVADMSCLGKNLDLRLMVCTQGTITSLTDDEIEMMKCLVSNATLDPKVKGGLRWPFGKNSMGDRYTVVGVWHVTSKSFGNSSIKVKVRQADRFDFRSSLGEYSGEVTVKMRTIISLLLEEQAQSELISTILKHNLRLIWEYLLSGSAI